MFFFSTDDNSIGAADAFRVAISKDGTTTTEVAKRLGLSRTALSKFIEGRPLSPSLLRGIMQVLSPNSALRVLYGHLRDEVKRGGQDPAEFTIVKSGDATAVLNLLFKQMHDRPDRIADLMDLALKWQRLDLEEKVKGKAAESKQLDSIQKKRDLAG